MNLTGDHELHIKETGDHELQINVTDDHELQINLTNDQKLQIMLQINSYMALHQLESLTGHEINLYDMLLMLKQINLIGYRDLQINLTDNYKLHINLMDDRELQINLCMALQQYVSLMIHGINLHNFLLLMLKQINLTDG